MGSERPMLSDYIFVRRLRVGRGLFTRVSSYFSVGRSHTLFNALRKNEFSEVFIGQQDIFQHIANAVVRFRLYARDFNALGNAKSGFPSAPN